MTNYPESERFFDELVGKLDSDYPKFFSNHYKQEDADSPLFIIENDSDVAGFAPILDTPKEVYETSLQSFKELYREKHSVWKNKNLSFVVIRNDQQSTDNNDSYFSQIELDPYFCKKYVVTYRQEKNRLDELLQGLPFVPLLEGLQSGVYRPLTAISLLQRYTVPSEISRAIIQPNYRSPERIIRDIKISTSELPILDNLRQSDFQQSISPTEHTRIKSIAIEDFRAYRAKATFDLDADLIVVYGPNGLGKTSLFDALDFVCTGRIGRLSRNNSRQTIKDFVKFAKHLDADESSGSVSLKIEQSNATKTVTRTVHDWSNAIVDSSLLDRSAILQLLTTAEWGETSTRTTNFEKLFRATHLFSQSDPELFDDFNKESKISSDLVSRMLALEDYTTGIDKATKVWKLCRVEIKKADSQLETIVERINNTESRIAEIPAPTLGTTSSDGVTDLASQLIADSKKIGIDLQQTSTLSLDTTKSWQATLNSEKKISMEEAQKWRLGLSMYPEHLLNLEKSNNCKGQLNKLDSDLEKSAKKLSATELRLKKLNSEMASSIQKRTKLVELKNSILEYSKASSEVITLEKDMVEARSRHGEIAHQLATNNAAFQETAFQIEHIKIEKQSIADQLQDTRTEIDVCKDLLSKYPSILIEQEQLEKRQSELKLLKLEFEKANDLLEKSKKEFDNLTDRARVTQSQYDRESKSHSSLSNLLSQIESHIDNANCPTCGHKHGSKEELLQLVRLNRGTRPKLLEKLLAENNTLIDEIEVLNLKIESFSVECSRLETQISKMEISNGEAKNQITDFFRDLQIAASISLDIRNIDIVTELQSILSSKEGRVVELETALLTNTTKIQKLEVNQKKTNLEITAMDKKLVDIDLANKEKEEKLNSRLARLEQLKIVSGTEFQETDNNLDEVEASLVAEDTNIAEININLQVATIQLRDVTKEIEELKLEQQSINTDLTSIEDSIREFQQFYYDNDQLPEKSGLEGIVDRLKARLTHVDSLIHRCSGLEYALDIESKNSTLNSLQLQLSELQESSHSIRKERQELEDLYSWFKKIEKILDNERIKSVKNHVDKIGPLSTSLQNRLRSVYGFGDIKLNPDGNQISVEVDWKGMPVPPTLYFSDAQKQILMLCVFLSGRLSQTWSGFAPIFLDDPISHFDDLNDFSFVELIRGIINSPNNRKQFILSTCEEKLFSTLKQKFGKSSTSSIFYKFTGIGKEGPEFTLDSRT